MRTMSDKLVLFLEEDYEGSVDMSCYVVYDATEKEYFICGQRMDDLSCKYAPFHFYCKSKRSLLKYIRFITNAEDSRLTYGLFNFPDIYFEEMVDYSVLDKMRSAYTEIAVYVKMDFDKKIIHDLLVVLKDVRY